jgi:hypothetical protein
MSGRILFLPSILILATISSASRQAGDPPGAAVFAPRQVQIVYESDTRGYYLPCG